MSKFYCCFCPYFKQVYFVYVYVLLLFSLFCLCYYIIGIGTVCDYNCCVCNYVLLLLYCVFDYVHTLLFLCLYFPFLVSVSLSMFYYVSNINVCLCLCVCSSIAVVPLLRLINVTSYFSARTISSPERGNSTHLSATGISPERTRVRDNIMKGC